MVLAVPIIKDGKIVGVLANAMTTNELSQRVATWKKGETGYAFLVDEKGKVVAHPEKEFVIEEKNLGHHPLVSGYNDGNNGLVKYTEKDGTKVLGWAERNRYGWILATRQAQAEAYKDLRWTQIAGALILLSTIIVVILISLRTGKAIAAPVMKLTEIANRISVFRKVL